MYKYKMTEKIAKEFERRDINHYATSHKEEELIIVDFPVPGSNVKLFFLIMDDEAVAARAFLLFENVPKEKRGRMLEAINKVNHDLRFIKLTMDDDGDVNGEYDFPLCVDEADIGSCAFEIYTRFKVILQRKYQELARVLCSDVTEVMIDPVEYIRQMLKIRQERNRGNSPETIAPEDDTEDTML